MNIVLVHPVHGAKVATLQAELENDLKHGWTEYNANTPQAATRKPRKAKVEDPQPVEQPNGTPDFLAPVSDESAGE